LKLLFDIPDLTILLFLDRDFLPRGTGIVTRRPLVLQLYCINPDEYPDEMSQGEEWGEFLHVPGQKFFDFNEIRDEIVRETDRVTGKNKGISNKPINLKIFSPFVLNLTLVDLPGITKVPTGDQPEDVEELIRNMCFDFISNPNAIILAVTAANQDLANSDALKLARAVDPDGERTVGVLTKVDIMDQGTDCCDILENKVIPLRKGYIAVINRSQKDIQENLEIRKGLAKEFAYFQTHPKYRNILSKCGTRNLARILNQLLMVHIRDVLPEIKTRINKLLVTVSANLESLGDSIDDQTFSMKGATLLKIISQFSNSFHNKIDGKASNEIMSEMTELYGGARISYIFNEIFSKKLKNLDPFEGLEDDDIRTAIANANGTRPSLFVPEISFDLLVRRQIARLEQPGLQCLDLIVDEMYRMIQSCETLELNRFPELKEKIYEIVNTLLKDCIIPSSKMISNLIQIELAYINTSHPDFIGGKAAVAAAQQAHQNRMKQMVADNSNPANLNNPGFLHGQSQQQQQQLPPPPASPIITHGLVNNMMTPGGIMSPPITAGLPGLGGGGGFLGLFASSSKQPPANIANHAKPAATNNHNGPLDDLKGIRLPNVPEKMRCNSVPTDKERS
jgi:dynamin 1-like protein